jgi:hypothetical protein
MPKKTSESKRYNMVLPNNLYEQIKQAAETRGMTVVEMLRKFIKIGLLAIELQDKPEAALIIREGNTERQLYII